MGSHHVDVSLVESQIRVWKTVKTKGAAAQRCIFGSVERGTVTSSGRNILVSTWPGKQLELKPLRKGGYLKVRDPKRFKISPVQMYGPRQRQLRYHILSSHWRKGKVASRNPQLPGAAGEASRSRFFFRCTLSRANKSTVGVVAPLEDGCDVCMIRMRAPLHRVLFHRRSHRKCHTGTRILDLFDEFLGGGMWFVAGGARGKRESLAVGKDTRLTPCDKTMKIPPSRVKG